MYIDFYNLQENPFNLTPSSRFLYLGESHNEAYALLTYGVMERKGFVLLTGEVGTGKTTIVRSFVKNLDPNVQCVYLSNPLLSPSDFINYLSFSVFNKEIAKSKVDFLIEFESFLNHGLQHQKNFLLIIDEAQKLSLDLLEEVRLLSNMEAGEEKLINIFLVGQPELNDKLNQPECRPLLQRISIRHHIQPLNLQATEQYLATRLRAAGNRALGEIFPKPTIKAVHRYSSGYPRLINILADNAMLYGYSKGQKKITSGMIQRCYEEMELAASPFVSKRHATEEAQTREKRILPFLFGHPGFAVAAIAIMIAAFVVLNFNAEDLFGKLNQYNRRDPHQSSGKAPIIELAVKSKPEFTVPPEKPAKDAVIETNVDPNEAHQETKTVSVKSGDTLIELTASMYGRADDDRIVYVLKHNPDIKDGSKIEVGQKIQFPFLSDGRLVPEFTVHIASLSPFRSAYRLYRKLMTEGYEAYILPVHDTHPTKTYRIAVGSFMGRRDAQVYAGTLLARDISNYAEPMKLDTYKVVGLRGRGEHESRFGS